MLDESLLAVLKRAKSDILADIPVKEGTVRATEKSFGFLEADGNESFFIAPPDMKKVFHGDKVKVRIREDNNGRSHAEPFELITPFLTRTVARIYANKQNFYAKIDHPNYHEQILAKVPNEIRKQNPQNGDWVIVELSDHPLVNLGKIASVKVTEIIARQKDPKVPWLVSLRKYDLPVTCPADPDSTEIIETYQRKDLTQLPFITIDSPDTKDMDDALYIEDAGDHWYVYVAIADPTSYIEPHSNLDHVAEKRAFTCYLPGMNIPIIPHIFSENLCSLMENQERNVLAVKIHVNKDGTIPDQESCEFYLASIKSHAKLSYDNVSDYLEGKKSNDSFAFTSIEGISEVLQIFKEFTLVRAKFRENHTISFKDKLDYHYVLNTDGSLNHIEVEFRRIANQIVEESMILANECAGKFLNDNLQYGIFNKHTGFDQEKLSQVVKILKANGFEDVKPEDLSTMEGFYSIRKKISEQPTKYLDVRLRKFQVPAEMVTTPSKHFGLGINNYATWTSPIRKYGDMINHRLIKCFITNQNISKDELIGSKTLEYLNLGKKVNRYAERDVKEWLNIEYIKQFIGKEFEAEINDISRGGIRAILIENGVVVFIPMSLINPTKNDQIVANNEEGRIFNNGNMMYELAMKIRVKPKEVDDINRNIIADLII